MCEGGLLSAVNEDHEIVFWVRPNTDTVIERALLIHTSIQRFLLTNSPAEMLEPVHQYIKRVKASNIDFSTEGEI